MNNQLQTPAIKKLDGTNYKEWAFDVGLVLRQKMCWGITTGTETEPDGPTPAVLAQDGTTQTEIPAKRASAEWLSWSQRREIATSTILLTMERHMQQKYMDFDEPYTLWEKIKGDYVTKIKKNSYTIRKELYGVRLEDAGSVEAYAQRVQQAIDQFNLTAEEDSEKMSDREHSFFLLNGINPASSDWSVTLQLIQDRIESESLDRKPEEVLLKLLARETELRKNKGIPSDTLLYTKGSKIQRSSTIQRIIRRRSVRTANGRAMRSRTVSGSSEASLPAASHRRKRRRTRVRRAARLRRQL